MNWREAEQRVADYLRSLGWEILARNYRAEGGELDIVAREGRTVVFVEVKSSGGAVPHPSEAVDERKLERMRRAATAFLAERGLWGEEARFDVVEVVGGELTHIRNVGGN